MTYKSVIYKIMVYFTILASVSFGLHSIPLYAKINEVKSDIDVPLCGHLSSQHKVLLPFVRKNNSEAQADLSSTSISSNEICMDILSPQNNSDSSVSSIDIVGQIQPYSNELEILAEEDSNLVGDEFDGIISVDGSFLIQGYPLLDGQNMIRIQLNNQDQIIGSQTIQVTWISPSEASADVTISTGGRAVVTSTDSSILGAAIYIPPYAATRDFRALVYSDPEFLQTISYNQEAVSSDIVIEPIGEIFSKPIEITVPINSSIMPQGRSIEDVKIIGNSNVLWEEFPIIRRSNNSVTFSTLSLAYSQFIAVVHKPLQPGELRIESSPGGAAIIIDGHNTNLQTPDSILSVVSGQHNIQLYIPGYNEIYQTINVSPEGADFSFELVETKGIAPIISFDNSIVDGMTVNDNVFNIKGNITFDGQPIKNSRAVINLNDSNIYVEVDGNGNFSNNISLLPGDNVISLRINGSNGNTGVSNFIHIINDENALLQRNAHTSATASENSNITIILSWDKADADVDLHVFDPNQNHAWYSSRNGIPGGSIDVDDIDGYGPETFTLAQPISGTYEVNVDYYHDHDAGPTNATLEVYVGNTVRFSKNYSFISSDRNATSGKGSNSVSFWNAYKFSIGDLFINSIETFEKSKNTNAIFTTLPEENLVKVFFSAPADIIDGDVRIEVVESVENFNIDTSNIRANDRIFEFRVAHKKLISLINPRNSHRLTYTIKVYALDNNGNKILESEPIILKQDIKSQIRQEYIDKEDFDPSFRIPAPSRGVIIDAGSFPGSNFFTFKDFAINSDFGGQYAILDRSIVLADIAQEFWGKTYTRTLVLGSGWRNPRRNDSLKGSSINSFHQTGDAIDINPGNNKSDWPEGVNTRDRARRLMYALMRKTFNNNVDVIQHGGTGCHIHLEYDNAIFPQPSCG